jgi:hypothetical protein
MASDADRDLQMRFLADEARGMLYRLSHVKPFALHETMVPAAAVSVAAQSAIEHYLSEGRVELRRRIHGFLQWLAGPVGARSSPANAHRKLAFLRLRFNAVLSHFDVFSIVMTQRSEHQTGVWLSGLDVVARDALTLREDYYELPPVVCYLDRGFGAAIRRARTRLPGGGETPVAIIRVPRERMVGSGIAASLVHEVGHQGAALLDLVGPMRLAFQREAKRDPAHRDTWHTYERWTSEMVADLWSVAMIGIGSTLGLMGVLALPRAFVFRAVTEDPHPVPWIRAQLSCAIGEALYPDRQWKRLRAQWASFYPLESLRPRDQEILMRLAARVPDVVRVMLEHRPALLRGARLVDAMPIAERTPARLRALRTEWGNEFRAWRSAPPTLAFAVLGQARADRVTTPDLEGRLLGNLLSYWALRTTIDTSEACAVRPAPRRPHRISAVQPSPALGVA